MSGGDAGFLELDGKAKLIKDVRNRERWDAANHGRGGGSKAAVVDDELALAEEPAVGDASAGGHGGGERVSAQGFGEALDDGAVTGFREGGGGKGMRVARSAEEMRLTADDMLRLGIVEKVISEPENLTRSNISDVTNQIASDLAKFIEENLEFDGDALCEERYKRYRKYGA